MRDVTDLGKVMEIKLKGSPVTALTNKKNKLYKRFLLT